VWQEREDKKMKRGKKTLAQPRQGYKSEGRIFVRFAEEEDPGKKKSNGVKQSEPAVHRDLSVPGKTLKGSSSQRAGQTRHGERTRDVKDAVRKNGAQVRGIKRSGELPRRGEKRRGGMWFEARGYISAVGPTKGEQSGGGRISKERNA